MNSSFSREMGFDREEFFRLLPNALGNRQHTIDAEGASVDVAPGNLRIDVGGQQHRHIASISMPYVKVDFEFTAVSDGTVLSFCVISICVISEVVANALHGKFGNTDRSHRCQGCVADADKIRARRKL